MRKRKSRPKNVKSRKNSVGAGVWLRRVAQKMRRGLGSALYGTGIIAVAIATLLGSAAAVYSLVRSPYFKIRDVEVRGTERITRAQVMKLMDISRNPSIFDVRVRGIENTLSENPWVESALARRKFPDRLIVDVTERTPRAIVNLNDLYYVDKEGIVFKRVSPGDSLDYPVLTGLKQGDIDEPGGRELLERALALQLLFEGEARFGPSKLSEIHISRTRGFTVITMGDGLEIQFGLDNFPLKMETLIKLLDQLEKKETRVRFIDLSFRNMVVVRPAKDLDEENTVGL
jgi:cell division septal protein FtsQ